VETKWFSVKRYEFQSLIIGVGLLVGSWFLSNNFGVSDFIVGVVGILGLIITLISGVFIVLSLISLFL